MQQDVSCLASINRFHPVRHSTVSLNPCCSGCSQSYSVKESRCCAARFCLFVPMQYEGLRASILYQVPIFMGLPGIPGLVLYIL
jgi:hypothetical protein